MKKKNIEADSPKKVGFFSSLAFKIVVVILIGGSLAVGLIGAMSILDSKNTLEDVYKNYNFSDTELLRIMKEKFYD